MVVKSAQPLVAIFFVISSLAISINVYAQVWQYVTTSESGVNYSIDLLSVRKNENQRDFAQLTNHPDGYKYENHIVYSVKSFRSLNCGDNSYRLNYLIAYSKINGEGEVVLIDKNLSDKWVKSIPESVSSKVQKIVCK